MSAGRPRLAGRRARRGLAPAGRLAQALAEALRALVVDGGSPCAPACRASGRSRPSWRQPRHGLRAYDRLREDGFLVSARGAGSWLTLPDAAGPRPRRRSAGASTSRSPRCPRPSRSSARRPPTPRGRSPATPLRTATRPPACPSCAPRSPRASASAASTRRPTRCWSRPAPSTRCTSCCGCCARRATACSSTLRPTRAASRRSAACAPGPSRSRSRRRAGTPARGSRRSRRRRRGWR